MMGASAGAPSIAMSVSSAPTRNKPTQKQREEHEAAHVPSRDWCTQCMAGRGRTHHHVTKQESENHVKTSWQMEKLLMKGDSEPVKGPVIPLGSTICAEMITEMRGADLIVFRNNLIRNIRNLMRV